MKLGVLLLTALTGPTAVFAQTKMPSEPLTSQAYEAVASFFEYDNAIPLDANILARSDTQEYTHEKIVCNRLPGQSGAAGL
jgi:hypothetical protein